MNGVCPGSIGLNAGPRRMEAAERTDGQTHEVDSGDNSVSCAYSDTERPQSTHTKRREGGGGGGGAVLHGTVNQKSVFLFFTE